MAAMDFNRPSEAPSRYAPICFRFKGELLLYVSFDSVRGETPEISWGVET
ncbi:hypothetical protein FBY35_5919 [Streptomyces sp. SLBN-118]|nr:hypothetical protein FBY35_5919 [Streptomyces sp. SLBN-118]